MYLKADVFAFARYCPTSEEKDTGMSPVEYRELLKVCDKKFKEYEAAGGLSSKVSNCYELCPVKAVERRHCI